MLCAGALALAGCPRSEIDGCRRLGSRHDFWRSELEASLSAGAISKTEWGCKLDALKTLDDEVTERCRNERVSGAELLADRDQRYRTCESG